jgi:hypothetical protein
MILRITSENSRTRGGADLEIFYVREQPYSPGRSIQTTALHLEGALWQARRIDGVTQIETPKMNATT